MTAHVIPPPPQGGPDEAATGLRAFHPVGQHAMGWCYDPEDPTRRFVIDVRVDGESMSLVLAETFIPTLRDRFGGDGCHGFLVRLDRSRLAGAVLVEAATGHVAGVRALPWYMKGLFLAQPLHFGDYGGLPLKVIWALLDLLTIWVLGSGLYLWFGRRSGRRTVPLTEAAP